jgi:hypothetical protein
MATINAAGVDPMAIRLVSFRERTIGQRRELFVEIGRLAELRRSALLRGQSADDSDKIMTNIFEGAAKGAAVGPEAAIIGGIIGWLQGLGSVAEKRQQEKDAIGDQLAKLTATATQLQRDIIEYQTEHAQVITNLQAKYSDQDWNFMIPKEAASAQK